MSKMNLNIINRRSSSINSNRLLESTVANSDKYISDIESMIERKTANGSIRIQLQNFVESMCTYSTANANYYKPIMLIEKLNDNYPTLSSYLLSEYTSRIIPYITDLDKVSNAVDRYSKLTPKQSNTIKEAVSVNGIADRIINNHKNISEKIDIERDIVRLHNLGTKAIVENTANIVDKYNLPGYQKLNVTIEESVYVMDKMSLGYNKSDVARVALEYFLLRDNNANLDYYKRAIDESYVMEPEDSIEVKYLLGAKPEINSIRKVVDQFIASNDNSISAYADMCNNILRNTTKEDIIANVDKLVYTLYDVFKVNRDNQGIIDCFDIITFNIINLDYHNFSREEIDYMIDRLYAAYNDIKYNGNATETSVSAAEFLDNGLSNFISNLKTASTILYSRPNLEALYMVNNSTEILPLKEFKIFKFNNLVKAAFNMDKHLKTKTKEFYTKHNISFKNFIEKSRSLIWGESTIGIKENMFAYIGEDARADICVMQYFYNESEYDELFKFVSEACIGFNNRLALENNATIRAYYMTSPGMVEVRVKDSTMISLDEHCWDTVRSSFDNSFISYMNMIEESVDSFKNVEYDILESFNIDDAIKNMNNSKSFTLEHFQLALEAMQFLDIDKKTVSIFADKYSDYSYFNESADSHYATEKVINEAVSSWEPYTGVPLDIQFEAYTYLVNIFEAGATINKPAVNKPKVGSKAIDAKLKAGGYYDQYDDELDDEDSSNDNLENNDKKEEKSEEKKDNTQSTTNNSGSEKKPLININAIKLALAGLRTKFKEMDTKQKEASKNLDNAVRAFVNSVHDAFVADRREAVLRGNVVPSFSRCIKAAIVLAGLGIASGGVGVPIIVGLGAMCVSKKLNDKERLILLDEIETEIEVIDKELQIAESNNEMKKYRALLKYKKELQRQYQRIRYNIKSGKILGSANTGMPKRD